MKKLLLTSLIIGASLNSYANYDLKRDGFRGHHRGHFIKTLRAGQSIDVDLGSPQYVEDLLIFAEGKQRAFSFADVYADGELISTLGVPGFDPDYPVVVRGKVKHLKIVARNNSKVKILDFKINTTRKNYSSYGSIPRASIAHYNMKDWGLNTIDAIYEMYAIMITQNLISEAEFLKYVQPIRRAAMKTQASDNARNAVSAMTLVHANQLAKALNEAQPLLDKAMEMMDQTLDMIAIDLMTIKEDITEQYGIKLK